MVGSKLEKLCNGDIKHYRHCLANMQCNLLSLDCCLGTCSECPGDEQFCAELQAIVDDNDVDKVEYRQWTNTDRSTESPRCKQVLGRVQLDDGETATP